MVDMVLAYLSLPRVHGQIQGVMVADTISALRNCLTCPLSGELMDDPYILCETGVSYQFQHIEAHVRMHGTNPATGRPLEDTRIVPNTQLKTLFGHVAPWLWA